MSGLDTTRPDSITTWEVVKLSTQYVYKTEYYTYENFVPTELTAAEADGMSTKNWIPYIVDHGGINPQTYPRPWAEGVTVPTELVYSSSGFSSISVVNLEPMNKP